MPATKLHQLPFEVLITIIQYLNIKDVHNLILTCKTLKNIIINDNAIWRSISQTRFIIHGYEKNNSHDKLWYNRCRISNNWCKGIYKNKGLIYHDINYMPWLKFHNTEALLVTVGPDLRCYPVDKNGFPNGRHIQWHLSMPKIERYDKRTNDISRFALKESLLVCGNRMETISRRRLIRRWRQRRNTINTRVMRDSADPLSICPRLFMQCFRVTKTLFTYLCAVLGNKLRVPQRNTSIPVEIKILTTLNFLATGSYQKPVSRDWLAPISQPVASRCIEEVVSALNDLLNTFIIFPLSDQERHKTKMGFHEKYGVPGVLGCIDGTLVAILAPRSHPSEAAFFSRKGYHAINAAIICDSNMRITGICAKFGGAAHDSFVWNAWSISRHLEQQYNSGKTGWLLGDSGYPQRPWLMTPVLHANDNTPEAHYTNMHVHTRVCVEQCIGLLKARWRCLLRHRVLHYKPTKCAKIINACAVLHNLCLNDAVEVDANIESLSEENIYIQSDSLAGNLVRQQLINTLWQNRPRI